MITVRRAAAAIPPPQWRLPAEPAGGTFAVPGAVIVGAGPSGLATAACLTRHGVPYLLLERERCLGSSWKLRMHERLQLHLPKQFCELPGMGFPEGLPTYPTREQFVGYLEEYARRFRIDAAYGAEVERAEEGEGGGRVVVRLGSRREEVRCRWLVVATGENAEAVVPEVEGAAGYCGRVLHSSEYRSGEEFAGERVLVVGCGNSGMELCLDLCDHAHHVAMVVRDEVHILPREMLGLSTFGLSMWLLKWLPIKLVDALLLFLSRILLGDTSRFGLRRPKVGPLQLKNTSGRTPVLDVGAFAKIKCGQIKVLPGIRQFTDRGVEFVDGRTQEFDSVIFATGYRSNVPTWLKEGEFFSKKDGFPRNPFPNSWKGKKGLYATGFTKRGLFGAAMDAQRIADDIASQWNSIEDKLAITVPACS